MAKTIGIFDSGLGGLSVKREIKKLLPLKKIIYLKDTKNFPYGTKTVKQLKNISHKNTKILLLRGADIIVVACNTATVNTISYLREIFPKTPFVGVEPGVKPAGIISKKGIIILTSPMATKSKQLHFLIQKYAKGKKVFNIGSLKLVEAIEKRKSNKEIKRILKDVLPITILNQADCMLLGCTHFPLIKRQIASHVGKGITIVDTGVALARQVKRKLLEIS